MTLSREHYEKVLGSMGVALICEDEQGLFLHANPAACQLLGLTEGLLNQQLHQLLSSGIDDEGKSLAEERKVSFWALKREDHTQKPIIGVSLADSHERLWIEIHCLEFQEEGTPKKKMLAALQDVSAMVKTKQTAKYQQDLQSLLLRITQTYISIPIQELDRNINQSLQELGVFIGADRIYIFEYHHEAQFCKNTYEWCAQGIEPQIEFLQETPYELFPQWLEAHLQGKTMLVQNVNELEPTSGLYQILAPQGIQSLIAVPMMDGNDCLGFVGIDAVNTLHNFTEAEQQLLQIFSKALVNVKKRFESENAVFYSEQQYRQMAENLTDVLWTSDVSFQLTYCSPSIEQLLGMSSNRFLEQQLTEVFKLAGDEDLGTILETLSVKARKGKFQRFERDVQAVNSHGETRWIHFSIKPNFSVTGEFQGFLGVLRDIHARKLAELELIEVKDQTYERYKELRCIYEIKRLSQDHDLSLEAYLQQVCELLPPAFHYPDRTAAMIRVDGKNYYSPSFFESDEVLSQSIIINEKPIGEICVYIRSAQFLVEETDLLKAVAVSVERHYENHINKQALHISEEKYRIIADNTFNWEFWISPSGAFLYHSPASERMVGYRPDELMADQHLWLRLVHPADVDAQKHHLESIANGSSDSPFEFRLQNKAGTWLQVEMVGQAVYSKDGTYLGIRGSIVDITERKAAELELQTREEQLRKLLATQTNYVIRTDLNGYHTYWNKKFEDDFGWMYHNHGLDGSDSLSSICEYDREKATKAALLCLANPGKIYQVELDKPAKDGSTMTTLWEFVGLVDANEQPIGVQCMGIDITERRKAERELQENAEFLTKLLATQTNYVIRTNLEGYHTYWNNKFEEEFGWVYGEKGLNKANSLVSICEHDRPKAEKAALECLSNPGKIVKVELDKPAKHGGIISTLWEFIALVDAAGNVSGVQCMGLDITERKQAELALKKREEQYRVLIESSDAAITMLDVDGNYLFMNQIAAAPYHVDASQLIGKNVRELFGENEAKAILTDISEVVASKSGKVVEPSLVIQGKKMWFRTSIQPIFDENQEVYAVFLHATDITLAKEAEIMLRKSEEKYKTLFFDSPEAYLMLSNGKFTECNKASEALIGGDRSFLIGKSPAEISPEYQPNGRLSTEYAGDMLQKVMQSGEESFEWMHLRANGEQFLAQVKLAKMWYEEQEVLFISWTDITEKKKAEEGIKRLSQVIEQSPISVFMTDLAGNITYANAFAASILDKNANDLLGIRLETLYPESVREAQYAEVIERLEAGLDWRGVLENQKPDGSSSFESATFFPVFASNGQIQNYISIKEDITERKAIEQKLLELNATLEQRIAQRTEALTQSNQELVHEIAQRRLFEEQLQAKSKELQTFFDVALDLLCIADIHGNFVKLNIAWEELLGYPIAELERKKFLEFVHPDDLDATLDTLSRLGANETVLSFTNRYRRINGEYRFIEWHSVPVGDYVYAAARDITDRIEQAEALQYARLAADEANRSKSEFLSRMSHELRTPLNSILGFAQLLSMGQLTDAQVKNVNHILRSGRHLLDLINEVLDISRIEAGRISVSVEPVRVLPLLYEITDLLTPYANSRHITMHVKSGIDRDLMTMADQQRLKQVVTNIINNALKYNKEHGGVWIDASILPADDAGQQFVKIVIRDTGHGIDTADIPKIFNPFERLGAFGTETEGTGLGLTVVKQLVELMGGRVEVESQLGHGSTFSVFLPPAHHPKLALEESKETLLGMEVSQNQTGTILYVEDNVSNLELVEQILALSNKKIELVHTSYGKLAAQMVLEHQPLLVLLDLNLPDIHGSQVLADLKANPATKDIPVIVVSADAMPKQIEDLKKLGAVNYLTKPLDVHVFLHEIDKYMAL